VAKATKQIVRGRAGDGVGRDCWDSGETWEA